MENAVPTVSPVSIVSNTQAPAYWMLDILWTVLVTSDQTDGAYSLIEQIMPEGAAPPPHVHPYGSEVFYLFAGDITYHAGEDTLEASSGALVVIPRNTVHSFEVKNASAHVLNFYVPGGWEQVFPDLARPATARTLPPKGQDDPHSPNVTQFLTNYWGAPAGLSFARQKFGRTQGIGTPPNSEGGSTKKAFVTPRDTAPNATEQNTNGKLLASAEQTEEQFSVRELTLAAGSEMAFPADAFHRCCYVLDGGLRLHSGAHNQDAAPGTCLVVAPHTAHSLRANEDAVRILAFATPAGSQAGSAHP